MSNQDTARQSDAHSQHPDGEQDVGNHAAANSMGKAEQEDAERRSAPPAQVVYEAIRQEGVGELERSPSALAWSGLAAGLSMGFSLVAEGLLRAHVPDVLWRPLITHLGYSVGFLIVVLGRQQLFTENTLTVIIPLLKQRTLAVLGKVLRLWAVVLAANLVGALLFALIVGHTDVFEAEIRQNFAEIAREALRGDFWTTVLRGVFAGWLIALMVWLLPAAESARVIVIAILTYLVALGGFAHIVAGAVEVFYLGITGAASWGEICGGFLAPTLIGNILGGVSLVAALNHAQVVSGDGDGQRPGEAEHD